jgi:hypothetical protein
MDPVVDMVPTVGLRSMPSLCCCVRISSRRGVRVVDTEAAEEAEEELEEMECLGRGSSASFSSAGGGGCEDGSVALCETVSRYVGSC